MPLPTSEEIPEAVFLSMGKAVLQGSFSPAIHPGTTTLRDLRALNLPDYFVLRELPDKGAVEIRVSTSDLSYADIIERLGYTSLTLLFYLPDGRRWLSSRAVLGQ